MKGMIKMKHILAAAALAASPATGNTDKLTYILIFAGAGVLAVVSGIIGIISKKKKKK